jgi:serine protease Do
VVVTAQGLVLTNNHVVAGADEIRVTLSDGREFLATIVGTDEPTDLAVIQLRGDGLDGLSYLALGDAEALRLGEIVLAVGNPFGLAGSVTMGIVSAKGRANVGIVDYEDFIQTDAAINPGNSGGALVNLDGELVGINTAIASRSGGSQGIGFAIPTTLAREIMSRLLDDGSVQRSWLGVYIQPLSRNMARAFGAESVEGVLVAGVQPDSPAESAGVERGDVILSFDGHAVASPSELRNLVALSPLSESVQLAVFRADKIKKLKVKLGPLPVSKSAPHKAQPEQQVTVFGGLSLGDLDERFRQHYQLGPELSGGVVVRSVEPDSAASAAGIRPGDVIVEVNRNPVRTMADLGALGIEAGAEVVALVVRGDSSFYVLIG